jgi:hypothetical protein
MSSFSHQQKKQMDVAKDTALIGGLFKKKAGQEETDASFNQIHDQLVAMFDDQILPIHDILKDLDEQVDAHSANLKDNNELLQTILKRVAALEARAECKCGGQHRGKFDKPAKKPYKPVLEMRRETQW